MDEIIDHCWLLDLDRTLSSVEVVMEAVQHVCDQMGLDYNLIEEQKKVTEAHGHSFSAPAVFRSLWPEQLDNFCDQLKVIDHLDCIYPDATIFLQQLSVRKIPHAIITYGDALWQETKLHFGGLEQIPYIVCDIPEKYLLLNQYKHDGLFEIHTQSRVIRTKSVTLVDDKLEAFLHMPEGARSIYMNRSEKNTEVPRGIREVKSFTELLGEIS